MITPKIQNLFHFIEFLHSNIENFNQYESEKNELYLLDKERQKLNPNKNFAEKMEYDKIHLQIKNKHKVFQDNIIQPIKDKANELNICNPDESPTLWNYNISEILELKENFENEDLPVIFNHKNKYLEYRTKTKGEAFFGLGFFFKHLDLILKELFNYFNETEQNEFEAFETKAVRVNCITEAVELLKQGHKVTLPLNFLDLPKEPQQNNTETQNSNAEQEKPVKTLSDLITHENNTEIVEGIKIQYKNIKGKRLKLLLLALQELNLLPNERIAQKFYDCCKAEFGWDVATYPAMNDYKFNEYTDKIELDNMKKFLEEIIQTK